MEVFYVYVLFAPACKRSYVGATKNLRQRLRQHNREITGGAKTTCGEVWHVIAYATGFTSWNEALSFEKHIHIGHRSSYKAPVYRGIHRYASVCALAEHYPHVTVWWNGERTPETPNLRKRPEDAPVPCFPSDIVCPPVPEPQKRRKRYKRSKRKGSKPRAKPREKPRAKYRAKPK